MSTTQCYHKVALVLLLKLSFLYCLCTYGVDSCVKGLISRVEESRTVKIGLLTEYWTNIVNAQPI